MTFHEELTHTQANLEAIKAFGAKHPWLIEVADHVGIYADGPTLHLCMGEAGFPAWLRPRLRELSEVWKREPSSDRVHWYTSVDGIRLHILRAEVLTPKERESFQPWGEAVPASPEVAA